MAFVKFSRGLTSIYNNLSVKDPDTLYLVYDTPASETGSLYLGNKLISSVSSSAGATSLAALSDVSLNNSLADGMILLYNASTGGGVWEAIPVSEIIPAGIGNDISFVDALNEISNPNLTDIAIINGDTYVYDGSNWIQLTNSELNNRISDLETAVGLPSDGNIPATGLYAEIEDIEGILENVYTKTEIDSLIAQLVADALVNAQHLKYKVVSSLAEAEDEADENTIYLVPKSETDTNNDYDEYFVVEGSLEKIGNWEVDLSNYIQTNDPRIEAIQLDSNDNLVITAAQVSDLLSVLSQSQLIHSVLPGVFNVVDHELLLVGIPSNLLNDYVTLVDFNAAVGNLNSIVDRVSNSSSLVEEINAIKASLIWLEVASLASLNNG